jgi:hypothetical protein
VYALGWKWRPQLKIDGVNATGFIRPAEPWEPASDE